MEQSLFDKLTSRNCVKEVATAIAKRDGLILVDLPADKLIEYEFKAQDSISCILEVIRN